MSFVIVIFVLVLLLLIDYVLVLIDFQLQMVFVIYIIDIFVLCNNVLLIGKGVKGFNVLVVLIIVVEVLFFGLMFLELLQIFFGQMVFDCILMNIWEDQFVIDEINCIGKCCLVIVGLWISVCIVGLVLLVLVQGFEVYVIIDVCGDVSEEVYECVIICMVQVGVVLMISVQYLFELQCDWVWGEIYDLIIGIVCDYVGGYGIGIQYVKWMFGVQEGGY